VELGLLFLEWSLLPLSCWNSFYRKSWLGLLAVLKIKSQLKTENS